MKYGLITLTFFLTLSCAFAQKKDEITKNNVKSIAVTEEKNIKGEKIIQKDSETYFDAQGNILEEIEYKDGIIDTHFKYQYDSNNNKIKETELDKSGKIIKSSEYKYQGSLKIEKVTYDSNGKIKSRKHYTYEKF
jgi:antitoxin component YwqK of YwqJK toxin-antitoxin module